MASTPEGKVKEDIKRWLVQRGAWFMMPVSTGRGRVGIPDFIVCWRGHFIAIEAKAPKGRPTAAQVGELQDIQRAGGTALVVRDVAALTELIECQPNLRTATISVSMPAKTRSAGKTGGTA